MDDPVNLICKLILNYLVEQNDASTEVELNQLEFVKFHSDKLMRLGDVSISSNLKSWRSFCQKYKLKLRSQVVNALPDYHGTMQPDDAFRQMFLDAAMNWTLPVENIRHMAQNRYCLFFQRSAIKKKVLHSVLRGTSLQSLPYGHQKKNPVLLVYLKRLDLPNGDEGDSMTNYRVRLLNGILKRLFWRSAWTIVDDSGLNSSDKVVRIDVISSTEKKKDTADDSVIEITVGPVLEPNTKKITVITSTEYTKIRSNDMLLLALHKYGVRTKQDTPFLNLISRLGTAAVTFDLFEVRPPSPVLLIRNGMGSSKGASFVLYNSSRLETLLRSYDQLVSGDILTPLPDFDDVDLDLLREEDEWQLIFGYILRYPNLIERSVENIAQGQCAIHLIVRFINELVAVFSGYYRRTQILIKRPNLISVVHARLYLIKAVRYVLNDALSILNIEPVQFM